MGYGPAREHLDVPWPAAAGALGYEGECSERTVRRQTAVGLVLQALVALVLLLGGVIGLLAFDVATASLAVNGLIMMVIVIWVARSGRWRCWARRYGGGCCSSWRSQSGLVTVAPGMAAIETRAVQVG
ncbi:hypothetical protein [Ruania alba]|uniref:Uncharacterized protein n=1 Tax=Ruania alba TaxID=648782 RepID=A0A1H5H758_9MICO|nr:hypothetical protein [Ruania alba]SEE23779.1 hypothetical protein SAMN04488554_1875 [Ruania alba]